MQYRVALHKIGVLRTLCQLWYLYTIVGKGQLCQRILEKVYFQKSRISKQNLRKMKQKFYGKYFQEGDAISQLTENNAMKHFWLGLLKDVACKDL